MSGFSGNRLTNGTWSTIRTTLAIRNARTVTVTNIDDGMPYTIHLRYESARESDHMKRDEEEHARRDDCNEFLLQSREKAAHGESPGLQRRGRTNRGRKRIAELEACQSLLPGLGNMGGNTGGGLPPLIGPPAR